MADITGLTAEKIIEITDGLDGRVEILVTNKSDVATSKGYVNHGAVAGTVRPSGYPSVEWVGSVEPTNAIDGDTWIDTSS